LLAAWDNTWSLAGSFEQITQTHLPPAELERPWLQGWWFTFVRNPWARVVSAWQMFEQNPQFRDGSYPRDLASVLRLADTDWTCGNWVFGEDVGLRSYLIPCVSGPLDKLHFIGQVEAIDTDWNTVQDCTGIRVRLGQHNATKHKHYRDYFTPETRDTVARIYRDDIERFDYSF